MSTVASSKVLAASLEYAQMGWLLAVCYGLRPSLVCSCRKGKDCPNPGKHPRGDEWQNRVTCDQDELENLFDKNPVSNVGLLLGPRSGIIDVEFDNDRGRETAERIFGKGCFTPTYKSGRSVHRLFKWNDEFPQIQKMSDWKGLEIRLGGGAKATQSILPPSTHWSGASYEWLPGLTPDQVPLAEVPAEIFEALRTTDDGSQAAAQRINRSVEPSINGGGKPQAFWDKVSEGVSEGGRNETAAQWIGRLLADLRDPFNADAVKRVWENVQLWNERNKPPLSHAELVSVFKSILGSHQRGEAGRGAQAERMAEQRPFDPNEKIVPEWRLVIVESNPRTYRLWSPLWSLKAPRGYIEIDAAKMHNPDAIRREALEQADVWVNRMFNKLWEGDKEVESMARKLVESAEYQPAPLESKRDLVIAEALLESLERARNLKEDEEPDKRGRPCRLQDGRIVFKFAHVWEPQAMGADRVKRTELSEIMRRAGIKEESMRVRGTPTRVKVASKAALECLRTMTGHDDVAQVAPTIGPK